MDITICICTWNRADSVDRALASVERMNVPPGIRWEVLVIDNGSTDHTRTVLDRYCSRLPLRVSVEAHPGVAHARAKGLAEAHGRLILWTDDDVVVDENWMRAYLAAAHTYPEAAFWGGRIAVRFETAPPAWLKSAWPVVASIFGERMLADEPVEIRERHQYPFGANYAARTSVHRRFPFDTRLGRCRDRYLGGEETAVFAGMLHEGFRGWWLPQASVEHCIGQEAATLGHIGRYWRGAGEHSVGDGVPLSRVPRLLVKAISAYGRYRLQRLTRPPQIWVQTFLYAQFHIGRFSVFPRRLKAPWVGETHIESRT